MEELFTGDDTEREEELLQQTKNTSRHNNRHILARRSNNSMVEGRVGKVAKRTVCGHQGDASAGPLMIQEALGVGVSVI